MLVSKRTEFSFNVKWIPSPTLSGQRAASVQAYLVSKGLKSTRFKTSGLGIADPIATNDTPEGRAQNRRVEFSITANDKMVNDAKAQAGK